MAAEHLITETGLYGFKRKIPNIITTRVDTEESHGILARYMEHYLAGILVRIKDRDKLVK
jgi:hypothetical protein